MAPSGPDTAPLSPRKLEVLRLASLGEEGRLHPHGGLNRRTGLHGGPSVWCRVRNYEAGDGHAYRCDRIPWALVRSLYNRGLLTPRVLYGDDPQNAEYGLTPAGRERLARGA